MLGLVILGLFVIMGLLIGIPILAAGSVVGSLFVKPKGTQRHRRLVWVIYLIGLLVVVANLFFWLQGGAEERDISGAVGFIFFYLGFGLLLLNFSKPLKLALAGSLTISAVAYWLIHFIFN